MTKIAIDPNTLYDVPDLVKILQMNEFSVRRNLRAKKFKGKKFGNRWFIPGASILEYFTKEEEQPAEAAPLEKKPAAKVKTPAKPKKTTKAKK
jgi:hypothetical protein